MEDCPLFFYSRSGKLGIDSPSAFFLSTNEIKQTMPFWDPESYIVYSASQLSISYFSYARKVASRKRRKVVYSLDVHVLTIKLKHRTVFIRWTE